MIMASLAVITADQAFAERAGLHEVRYHYISEALERIFCV